MTLGESRAAWAAGGREPEGRRMSDAELLALVLDRSAAFERTIRRRDWREMAAAGVAIVLLSPVLVVGPWLARVGVLLVIAGSALIAGMLTRARRLAAPGPDCALAEALRAERRRVHAQARLLETVLFWYIAPLAVGCVLVVAGLAGRSWATLGYAVVVALLSAGIYALNHAVVARELRPREAELDRMIADLED